MRPMPLALTPLLFIAGALASPAEAGSKVTLRLMETADIHMHIVDYDYYRDSQSDTMGLAKVANLVMAARAEVKNSLFFDNGDLIQGSPLSDSMALRRALKAGKAHPADKAMTLRGYDASTICGQLIR